MPEGAAVKGCSLLFSLCSTGAPPPPPAPPPPSGDSSPPSDTGVSGARSGAQHRSSALAPGAADLAAAAVQSLAEAESRP